MLWQNKQALKGGIIDWQESKSDQSVGLLCSDDKSMANIQTLYTSSHAHSHTALQQGLRSPEPHFEAPFLHTDNNW